MEFSELIHSVGKSDRTDKFKTLAALYTLNSFNVPVSVQAVNEVLRLHFRTKAPTNVNAILSKNSSLISVVNGKPLKWKLLDAGIDYLEKLSGLDLQKKSILMQYESDIGIVCALEYPEFEAVMNASGGATQWLDVSDPTYAHIYRETKISTNEGEMLRVVGVTATSMGLTAAAIATTQLAMKFKPKIIVMVGIAAGTQDGKKNFGDILVADPSVDYASGKVTLNNGVRDFQPDPYPLGISARLRSTLLKYRGDHQMFDEIGSKWKNLKPRSKIQMHIGPLGAADQVIDDPSRIKEIQMNWRKLIGIEMETYAVYRASHESPEPKPKFVSFKSVCDFAALKEDSWQKYAAFTAAEFMFRFFKKEWGSLWPKLNK